RREDTAVEGRITSIDRGASHEELMRGGDASVVGESRVEHGGDVDRARAGVADEVAVRAVDDAAGAGRVADEVVGRGERAKRLDVGWDGSTDITGDDGVPKSGSSENQNPGRWTTVDGGVSDNCGTKYGHIVLT